MSRTYDFSNLDLFSCQDLDNYGSLSPDQHKPQMATAVPVNDTSSLYNQEEFFYQQSTQSLVGSYQISFEKDFMKEHQTVFQKELQNYMESFRTYSNKTGGLQALENQLSSKSQKHIQTCLQFITAHRLLFSHEQTQTFVQKFNKFEKLSEFLNIVVSACPEAISVELIHIAKQLLEKYENLSFEDQEQESLLIAASDVAQNPKFVELTNLKRVSLSKCKEATDLKEQSKKFLEIYCATTILVIAQYFSNPYSSNEMGCFKRQLSPCSFEEQEEEFASAPAKKRKFDF